MKRAKGEVGVRERGREREVEREIERERLSKRDGKRESVRVRTEQKGLRQRER
jgi:hypothetical protein